MMIATREGSADGWHRGDPHVHAEAGFRRRVPIARSWRTPCRCWSGGGSTSSRSVSLDDDDAYFLMRAYRSVDERQQSQDAFYGSDEWRNGPREAIVSKIETLISVVVPAELMSGAGG